MFDFYLILAAHKYRLPNTYGTQLGLAGKYVRLANTFTRMKF